MGMEGFGLHTMIFEEDEVTHRPPLERNDKIVPGFNADDNAIESQEVLLPNPPRKSVFKRLRDWIRSKMTENAEKSREKKIAKLKRDLIQAKNKMNRIERMIYFAGKKDFQ